MDTLNARPACHGAALRRRQALGDWADAAAASLAPSSPDAARLPDSISVRGRDVDLGAWEKSVLRGAHAAAGPADEREAQVVDGLAYQAKCREVIDRLDHQPLPGPAELPAFIEELVLDAAVGLALQTELQRQVDALVQAGSTVEAKGLSAFRNRILRCASRLSDIVEGDLARRAAELAQTMIADAEERPGPRGLQPAVAELEERAEGPAMFRRQFEPRREPVGASARTSEPGRLPLRIMVPVLGVLALISLWLNFGSRLGRSALPDLGLEQFSGVPAVTAVVVRPPSLFVTVDQSAWDALAKNDQRGLLEEVARVVEGSGYLGLQIRTTGGVPVGQWSKQAGLKLAPQVPGAT